MPAAQPEAKASRESMVSTSSQPSRSQRPAELQRPVAQQLRPDEEEAAFRAEAEAAVERALERDRNSDWWKKLQAAPKKHVPQRCDRLPIHRETASREDGCRLPTRGFKVLAEVQPVRAQPCAGAPVRGGRKKGDSLRAVEEGWVKLAGEDGWICQGLEEAPSQKKCLEALEKPRALAVETLAKMPGRQMLEVVADDGVDILREPFDGALLLGRRSFGEFVLADSQSYHGWVRLSDNEGWAQAVSGSGEKLLQGIRPEELQLTQSAAAEPEEVQKEQVEIAMQEAARKEALRQLESAALSGNSAFFCAALEVARQKGVSKKDIARANAMRS
ncbi:unnamed protein product [Effrenium voratum]|uniref:Uncharacterized protein n=1 Tax=Effrenium voratum TaxID=2562239 RepID=A0AA36J495_9DINO|nr:unnamed protein product [Effrenium voratum]